MNATNALALQSISSEKINDTATELSAVYMDSTAKMAEAMNVITQQCDRLSTAFAVKAGWDFRVEFHYRAGSQRPEKIFENMKRTAWEVIVDKIGIKSVMSIEDRRKFDQQLEKGFLPDINPDSILSIVLGLVDQANDFATKAVREVFDWLRPSRSNYVTNKKYRVGRRVILTFTVEQRWDGKGFQLNYGREGNINALEGVFHVLDGKSPLRDRASDLKVAIEESPDGRGETGYFRFKCFKNRNLHLEFLRLDLVQKLNGVATGEFVLGEDES